MVTGEAEKGWGDGHGGAWRMVDSFALHNKPGSERLAVARVERAVGALQWRAVNLAAIGQAVGRAARGAGGRGSGGGRLVVRLFVQTDAAPVVDTPDGAPAVRGSGFFLILREEDGPSPLAEAKDTSIELFLFRE